MCGIVDWKHNFYFNDNGLITLSLNKIGHIRWAIEKLIKCKNSLNLKRVPQFIFDIKDKNWIGSFLQAIYDDDSFLYPQKNRIVLAQKSKELIKDIRELFFKIGIWPNQLLLHKSKARTTMHYFSITHQDNIRLFNELVGFKHPKKNEKLKILMNKCEGM